MLDSYCLVTSDLDWIQIHAGILMVAFSKQIIRFVEYLQQILRRTNIEISQEESVELCASNEVRKKEHPWCTKIIVMSHNPVSVRDRRPRLYSFELSWTTLTHCNDRVVAPHTDKYLKTMCQKLEHYWI